VALDVTPAFGPDFMDAVQLALGKWKAVGIETDLRLKEYGAFISSTIFGRFDHMAGTLFGSWTDPESYLVRYHMPGQITNASGVNDPKVTEMIQLQRRTFDVARRREIVYDLQRHLSQHVYHLYGPPPIAVAAWEPYVRDFAPNIGFDIGGRRLQAAWLDRSPDPAQEALAVLASVG
jgi:ABC-type transport system substrate-binding protein